MRSLNPAQLFVGADDVAHWASILKTENNATTASNNFFICPCIFRKYSEKKAPFYSIKTKIDVLQIYNAARIRDK
jgi:hypothetical protein